MATMLMLVLRGFSPKIFYWGNQRDLRKAHACGVLRHHYIPRQGIAYTLIATSMTLGKLFNFSMSQLLPL